MDFCSWNKKNRRAHLEGLRGEERTMIFYEAPHKLAATLQDLSEVFGPDSLSILSIFGRFGADIYAL